MTPIQSSHASVYRAIAAQGVWRPWVSLDALRALLPFMGAAEVRARLDTLTDEGLLVANGSAWRLRV